MNSHIGIIIKRLYDFVHDNPQLKELNLITKCAFKKLKKNVCSSLFGVSKSLQYDPTIKIDKIDEKDSKESNEINKRKAKAKRKQCKTLDENCPMQKEDINKLPINPILSKLMIQLLTKLLVKVSTIKIIEEI